MSSITHHSWEIDVEVSVFIGDDVAFETKIPFECDAIQDSEDDPTLNTSEINVVQYRHYVEPVWLTSEMRQHAENYAYEQFVKKMQR